MLQVKSSLMGASLNIPIAQGRLALGTWQASSSCAMSQLRATAMSDLTGSMLQGIYLGEHRDHGGSRKVVATIQVDLASHVRVADLQEDASTRPQAGKAIWPAAPLVCSCHLHSSLECWAAGQAARGRQGVRQVPVGPLSCKLACSLYH